MERDAVLGEIYAVIGHVNELRGPGEQIAFSPDTVLYGASGCLDSLGLVSLLIDVEEAISTRAESPIVLTDENAMSQRHNPFRTVGSLADYVLDRLNSEPT